MSHRPRVYRLDELADGDAFEWSEGNVTETGVTVYSDDGGVYVRLHRGREGWLMQHWPAGTLVRKTSNATWLAED